VLFYRVLAFLLAVAAPFVGPEACAKCHAAQFRTQSDSRHAAALRRAEHSGLASLLSARPVRERSGIEFSYRTSSNGVNVSMTQGASRMDALLEWAFGAGAQAITPVGRRDGRWVEHRISWYREPGHGARTLGHPGTPSTSPAQAFGIAQDTPTITRCFNCHATGVKPGPDLTEMQPGVTCERCHGPGATHVANPSTTNIVKVPSVQFCAECHRLDAKLDDPAAVRFQPVGLTASRCFKESATLSCVTCHNPHTDASQDAASYTERCQSCHAIRSGIRVQNCRRASGENCLPCHMKKVSPFPYLTFTDHQIRVMR
jgi:hypothetical protein